jgi:HEPN domain-containing protein
MPLNNREDLVRKWLSYAMEDLRVAVHILSLTEHCPTYSIAFHAQQSVEKNLKAFLLFHQQEISKTHNIGRLLELCQPFATWTTDIEETDELTYHAVVSRYPGIEEDFITISDAERFILMAEKVETLIQSELAANGLLLPDILFE